MRAECAQGKLKSAVLQAERVTGKNLSLPILGSVLLVADGQTIVVRATNLDVGVEIEIPAKVERKGSVAVSGSLLGNFLATIPDGQLIKLDLINQNLCISSRNTSTIIVSFPTEEFPTIPRIADGVGAPIAASELLLGFRSVSYAAAVSDVKPEIASVHLFGDGKDLLFVATDSFRLAEKRIPYEEAKKIPPVLLPFKNCTEAARLFEQEAGELELVVSKNQISFQSPSVYFTSRLVAGAFPNYRQIVPLHFKTEILVSKRELAQALKLGVLFSDKFHHVSLRVIAGENFFEVESKNPETGENTSKIDAEVRGEEVLMSFNVRYLLDCFQSIPEDRVVIWLNGAGKPLLIRGEGNSSFTYLVMPMNR